MMWAPATQAPVAHVIGTGFASDMRSDVSRNPYVYYLTSVTTLYRYNVVTKGWDIANASLGLGGSTNAGMGVVFAPNKGLVGTLSGGSPTRITLSTVAAAIGNNVWANRGGSGDYGFKIRIISTSAGKTEERFISANSAGTVNIDVTVDTPFSFTPAAGDIYELLSGSVYCFSAGTGTNLRRLDIATGFINATNSPGTTGVQSCLIALDEQYTPYDCHPGEGMIKGPYLYDSGLVDRYALVATGATSTTLTGHLTGGDYDVVTNEYRNFQIRIVEDTTTPSAVGQRRFIASHTSGPSAVYTLGSAWTTTPSLDAKYVIELPNIILLRTNGSTLLAAFNYGDQNYQNGTANVPANTWFNLATSTTAAQSGAFWMPSWGIRPDELKSSRNSYCFATRASSSSSIDLFDLAGGTLGTWTSTITYDGQNTTGITTGSCAAYDPINNEGRMNYIQVYATNVANTMRRFDVQNRTLTPFVSPDTVENVTGNSGDRMAVYATDGSGDSYTNILHLRMGSTVTHELLVLA